MTMTIKVNADLLNMDIAESIKRIFPHQFVTITIKEVPKEDNLEEDSTKTRNFETNPIH